MSSKIEVDEGVSTFYKYSVCQLFLLLQMSLEVKADSISNSHSHLTSRYQELQTKST